MARNATNTEKVTPEVLTKWQLTKPMPPGSVMTPAKVAATLESIANGAYIEQACAAAGINARTLRLWRERAEQEPDSAYGEFADLLEQARAHAETENVAVIKRAAESNWTAAAWLLERQYPQRWGRRDAVHSTGEVTHTLKIEFGKVAQDKAEDDENSDRYLTETA